MEDPYIDFKVLDECGKEIIGAERMMEIEADLDVIAAWNARLEPIRPMLERFERGGRYAAVAYDLSDGKIVFVNHDGTRAVYAPEQIAALVVIRTNRITYAHAVPSQ